MKYKVGMYGGSFNPLHNGHIKCTQKMLELCDEIHIIIGDIPNMDDFPVDIKLKWFQETFKDEKERVILHTLYDDRTKKSEYTLDKWLSDSVKIKEMIGKPIDVVFAGADYKNREDNPYPLCYPTQDIIYINRDDDHISSTEFRSDIEAHKDWVPDIVYLSYKLKNACFYIDGHILDMERVLVDYNCVPIFFICKDENNRYLALNSEPDNSAYIVVKISDADAYDLLHGNISMRDSILKQPTYWSVLASDNALFDTVSKHPIHEIDLSLLPDKNASYRNLDNDGWEYINQINKECSDQER